jgi:hypothetical protein
MSSIAWTDLERVANRIFGKQYAVESAAAHRVAQRLRVDAAVDSGKAADPLEREPEPELDPGEADPEADEQGPRVGRSRDLGEQHSDAGESDVEQLELDGTGVAREVRIAADEAAAGDHAEIDRDPEPGGGLELQLDVDVPERAGARRCGGACDPDEANILDDELDRSESE